MIDVLRNAKSHPSFEVRTATAELIAVIEQRRRDEQLSRLVDTATIASDIDLPGWDRFARLVGHDRSARTTFAKLSDSFSRGLKDLPRFAARIAKSEDARWDPYDVAADQHIRWMMLIWADIVDHGNGHHRLSPRIANALSNPSMGPELICDGEDHHKEDSEIVCRLIGRWIESQSQTPSTRTTLQIAMRYRCDEQARRLCQTTLANPSPAAATVTAMLAASAITTEDDDELTHELWRHVDDDRTSHVWQTIASKKTKIRTQVRDVAIALLLHRRGIDPREVGFAELQADPVFLFTDCSLGFADEATRRATHDRSMQRLGRR